MSGRGAVMTGRKRIASSRTASSLGKNTVNIQSFICHLNKHVMFKKITNY